MSIKKRVDIVKLQLVKEASVLYDVRRITSHKESYKLFESFLINLDREHFMVACLNIKNEPTNITTVSIGNISSSFASPRDVLKTAILSNSSKIILAHNHPSGDPTPSHADKMITEKIKKAAKFFDIEVLDHIIVGEKEYYALSSDTIYAL